MNGKRAKSLKNLVCAGIIALVMAGLAQGRTIYVDADANGLNDGTTWKNAYNYLQDALADANSVTKPVEIRVAEGVYTPDSNSADPNGSGDRTATFQLISGVTIKGGYAGFGQPDPKGRDIAAYETILSGDLDGNDIDVNDPAFLLWEPTRAENSYHVVTGSGTDANAILDGFTITGGNANEGIWEDPRRRGGGMYNYSGSPALSNCTFRGNSAIFGGGIYNYGSSPKVTNCMFSDNSARYGGGMYNGDANPTLTNCTFSRNSADWSGGGMNNSVGRLILANCTFSGNSAHYGGGGMDNSFNSPILINCRFSGNSAPSGGGMDNFNNNPTVMNFTVEGNSANYGGGGLSIAHFSILTVTNCIFWGNTADSGPDIWDIDSVMVRVTYSDVQSGWPGQGNIYTDPCFVEPGYWDANGTWVDGDYHLLAGSPCIDAGDPNYIAEPNETDLDGRPRVLDGNKDGLAVVDMGAYEYSPPIPAEVRVVPRTINLASKGRWITCYIWLGEDYNVADIDPNSVLLENEIEPERFWVDEEEQVAIAKFNRSEVQDILNPPMADQAEVTITGQLTDGSVFEGTDVIRVMDKGGRKSAKW